MVPAVFVLTAVVHRGNAAYNASKAAVKSLTEGLAHELRVKANCNVTAHLFMYAHPLPPQSSY